MNFLFAGYGWDSDLTCCITLGYSWHTKKYKNTEFFLTADLGSSLSTVLKNNAQFFFFLPYHSSNTKMHLRVFHSYENLSTVQFPNISNSSQINKLHYSINASLFTALPL